MTIFSCDFVFHLFGWCLVGSSHRKRIHRAQTDYDWKSTILWCHDDDWNGTIQCKHLSHFVCARNFSIIPIWLLLRVHAWSTMTTTNGFFVVVAVLRWLLLIVHIAIFGWCFAHRCCYIVLFHLFLVKNGWFMKKRRTSRPHKMPTHRTRWRINERTNTQRHKNWFQFPHFAVVDCVHGSIHGSNNLKMCAGIVPNHIRSNGRRSMQMAGHCRWRRFKQVVSPLLLVIVRRDAMLCICVAATAVTTYSLHVSICAHCPPQNSQWPINKC